MVLMTTAGLPQAKKKNIAQLRWAQVTHSTSLPVSPGAFVKKSLTAIIDRNSGFGTLEVGLGKLIASWPSKIHGWPACNHRAVIVNHLNCEFGVNLHGLLVVNSFLTLMRGRIS